MKNLHVLPTDKPSRLHNKNGELGNYPSTKLYIEDFKGNQHNSFHIYITSDEEIKEGDWCLDINKNIIILWSHPHTTTTPFFKKIILTTDQSLDGIQAIDDEFLEWFVKNPSCERVKIKERQHFRADKSKRINPLTVVYYTYKIIIPQEEVFEMYSHLYGKTVTMDDRFETKHIWSEDLSLKNKGRWIPQDTQLTL